MREIPQVEERSLGLRRTVHFDFIETLTRVQEALREQGFGVLTTIDVSGTLKAKLGEEMAPYTILGTCHPQLAYRALEVSPEVGLLLPCNVVVRETSAGVIVEAVDPNVMLAIIGEPALKEIAVEAREYLVKALNRLPTPSH